MEMVANIQAAEKETALQTAQDQMTPDRMEYLQNFLNSQSPTFGKVSKSGEAVGWTRAKAATEHKKLLPIIQDKLESANINLDSIVQTLSDGLGAEYVEVAKYKGAIDDEKAYTDHRTRLAYLDRVMKLLKLTDKDSDSTRIGKINVIINNVNRPDDVACNNIQEAEYKVKKSNGSH